MKTAKSINFKPKEIVKKLLTGLSERSQDVLTKRYGLGNNNERLTLEAIGTEYGITRERVRQIENFAIGLIKKSKNYTASMGAFEQLKQAIDDCGGIVHEQEFLDSVSKDRSIQNHVHFLLVVADAFTKIKEDDEFHHRWTTNPELAEKVHHSLRNLCENFEENDLLSETELINRFLKELKEIINEPKTETFAKHWLLICKMINKNPLGEWGLSKSPSVKMRGIRDFAYLVLRQKGEPMHFEEVAKAIAKTFGRKAHPATCHNELIKDTRFVLVGRGLYALTEWGYSKGTVIEVIKNILADSGALDKKEIIDLVLKKRLVKENTILVNLQNTNYFKKDEAGNYFLS